MRPVAVLIARSGPLTGHRYELEDSTVLGREDATITLPDEETSRRHAEIRVQAGIVLIEDLGSTNGTFVDGERIAAATELRGGETIKMGTTIFVLEVEVIAPSAEPIADPGSTRIAKRPEILDAPAAAAPIADPERTAQRPRPAAPPPSPAPIADPERTAQRPRPPAPPPSPEPIADPERTAQRPRPSAPPPPPRTPSPEPVADTQHTRLRPRPPAADPAPIADPERTAQRSRPKPREPVPAAASAAPRSRPPAPAAPAAPAAADSPFGAFTPAAKSRGRGAASRKLAPALASYATIIVTAVALVAYFAGR